jgi:lipoprotein-anchoring transpeptidase ErfK/SrfK
VRRAKVQVASVKRATPDCDLKPSVATAIGLSNGKARGARVLANKEKRRAGEIEVLVSERKLRFYRNAHCVIELPVGTARPGIQFYGRTRITQKRKAPTWTPTPNQRRLYKNLPASVPPGPKNPLGSRALNLAQGICASTARTSRRRSAAPSQTAASGCTMCISRRFSSSSMWARR